jgi:hypothetical protein
MGHMTYVIFEPPNAQPRDPADSKFFWAKNTQHQNTIKVPKKKSVFPSNGL